MTGKCTTVECLTNEHQKKKEQETGGQQLQLTTEQYGRLLQMLPNGLILVSTEGKIVRVNAQMEKMFGYRQDELIGKSLEILMPVRFRARHRKHVSDFVANPRIRPMGTGVELFGLRKNGEEFPVDISLSYLTTEGELVALAIVRDVTEQKNIEHTIELNYLIQRAISSVLRISLESISLDEQISGVLDLILSIPSFSMRSRGSIYLAEPVTGLLMLKAMHGFTAGQVSSCQTVPLDGGREVASSTCPVILTDCLDEHQQIQYSTLGSTGQYCVPIVVDERTLGLINIAVTGGHKRTPEEEEFLAAIANSLAGLIERHQGEEEKISLREQLAESEKFAALGRTTANVAHAIKNPLTPIGGFARRLREQLPDGTREKRYAGLIYSEVMRVENILRDVLLFSGNKPERVETCVLSEILDKALKMFEDLLKEKSIVVTRRYRDIPAIEGSKEQLLEAVENLITNSIDAMPAGGMLTVVAEEERVRGIPYIKVMISDTGQGINSQNIARIFEPFFTTKLLLKGTGLGLSIAKKVVEDHGGFIHVDSEIGAGASFSLYFPLKRK